jgi:hypothetical protein
MGRVDDRAKPGHDRLMDAEPFREPWGSKR